MKRQEREVSRRDLICGAAGAAAFAFVSSDVLGRNGAQAANEKLNIAAIGSGGMGASNINACSRVRRG